MTEYPSNGAGGTGRTGRWRSSLLRATGIAFLIAFLVVGLVVVCGGCGGGHGDSLIGRWANEEDGESIEFQPGGTVRLSTGGGEVEFMYEIDGAVIRLRMEGIEDTLDVGYSLDGDTLTLSFEGESVDYERAD